MNKKSQFKMFETIAILVVFFFILIIGLVFYASVEKTSMKKTGEKFEQQRDIVAAQLISNMPELECPTTLETDNCIDVYKLKVVKNIFNSKKSYYYDIFGFSRISVEEVYPGNENYDLYVNFKGDDESKLSFSLIQVPISLYDSIKKTKSLGILKIKKYG